MPEPEMPDFPCPGCGSTDLLCRCPGEPSLTAEIESMPESEMPALAPCPFCGSADVTIRESAADNPFVECRRCRSRGPEAGTRDWSIHLWSTRFHPVPVPSGNECRLTPIRNTAPEEQRAMREKIVADLGDYWPGDDY